MAAASAKQIELDQSHSEPRARSRRLWLRILIVLLALPITGFIALGLWPAQADFVGDADTAGVGKGGGGLVRQFPKMVLRADNPLAATANDERVQLGRLLFLAQSRLPRGLPNAPRLILAARQVSAYVRLRLDAAGGRFVPPGGFLDRDYRCDCWSAPRSGHRRPRAHV